MLKKNFFIQLVFVWPIILTAGSLSAAELDVKFKTAVDQKYDDNITFAEDNRKTDFITSLSAGTTMSYEGKRTTADLSVNLTQQLFWKNTSYQNLAENVGFHANHELTAKDSFKLSDEFSHAYEPASFEDEFEKIKGRYSYFSNRFDIGYGHDFSSQLKTTVGYGYDTDIGSRSDLLDSYVNRVYTQTDYVLDSKNAVFGRYEFLLRKLEPGGTAQVNTVSGGLQHYFTEQLNLAVSCGVDIINSYDGEHYTNPLWSATLFDQVNKKTILTLSYGERYSTNPYTRDVFNYRRLSGGVNCQVLKKLAGSASVFFGKGRYEDSGITDDLYGISTGLSYDIRENVKGNFSYTYSQTISNVDTREYRKNLFSLGVSAEF